MAIQAVFAQHILVGAAAGKALCAIGQAGVESGSVTLLAQGRPASCEQARVYRAVRSMTQGAVFSRRWMLPQKRPPFFLVTTETVVVN